MNAASVDPRSYTPQDQLYVWALVNPAQPTLVGELRLSPLVADCATFSYQPQWWHFPLSEDLPLVSGQAFTAAERSSAPGALGVSVSASQYLPRSLGPCPQLRDLGQLSTAMEDLQTQAPITAEMQRLLQPGVTLGGARPKAPRQAAPRPHH